MSEWWQKPYNGGPMAVKAEFFPRPLYPPSAKDKGKTPSKNGPDVLAYKRTICRLGRWEPWNPSGWDQAFNNAFSQGRGTGNVGDSGVAGFQRQMKIDPTGWIGSATFNTLASCRVPEGRPHAGEMAMDPNSVNLIMEAFSIYGGQAEPVPKPTQTTRQRALAGAVKWLGYKESPPNSNNTTFGAWYGMNYQPWCAMFVTYAFVVEAGGSPAFSRGAAYSYVPYVLNNAKAGKAGLSTTSSPMPGDLVTYDWGRDGVPDHIGIFESGTATSFNAIEGNTSTSDNSNGGEVMRRARKSSDAKIDFIRVKEP